MPFRDFDAARKESDRAAEPITFTLRGVSLSCLAKIPLGFSFELIDAPETPDSEGQAIRLLAKFLRRILIDDDNRVRLDELLARTDDPVTAQDIVDVTSWLGEVYSGRPLESVNGSSDTAPPSGPDSKPANSEEGADLSSISA